MNLLKQIQRKKIGPIAGTTPEPIGQPTGIRPGGNIAKALLEFKQPQQKRPVLRSKPLLGRSDVISAARMS